MGLDHPPRLTEVYVHAHPDDETLFTGGRSLLGARAGRRQVLVTMTDGSLGYDPAGRSAHEPGHDRSATAAARSHELHVAAALLGIDRLVELRYPDSGMAGWPENAEAASLCNRPVAELAHRLCEVFDEEGPCLVVSYDPTGLYGHPDHVATFAAALAAAEQHPLVEGLEAVVMTAADVDASLAQAEATGELLPEWLADRLVTLVEPEAVERVVDARMVADVKQAALAAHSTQIDNAALVDLDPETFAVVFGVERFLTILGRGAAGDRSSGS
jgi:LmbE family N-acetylglucosaminyl deacetylase